MSKQCYYLQIIENEYKQTGKTMLTSVLVDIEQK